ncbi:MAG: diguanylate cyclase [Lachnospiraceae bacterium]|nr:diguanylate cyclase [Lachnospiraceae bacterium]
MNSEIKMTMEQAQKQIEIYQQLFQEVRLLSASDLGMEYAAESGQYLVKKDCHCKLCLEKSTCEKECIARDVLKHKGQKTKFENTGTELDEIIERYVEVDGAPCVMELVRRVDADAVIGEVIPESEKTNMTEFYHMLYTDALSQAYNRRYFEDRIRKKVVTAGIAMIDLDDFKISNDTYGHEIGDKLLRAVVATIRGVIRTTDALIRYGGDEFLLVIPNISQKMFEQKLNEILYHIRLVQIPESKNLYLSVSIGAVMAREQVVEEVMPKADKLMYEAKQTKNTIVTEWGRIGEKDDLMQYSGKHTRQCILIVDDSEMNRAILYEMLHMDYDILEADSGEMCIRMLEEYGRDISLILLDIVMPGMNGFGVLEQMNRRKWIETIPVIMISSEHSDFYIRNAYDMGVSDYISRPFDIKVVQRRVNNTIKLYAKQRRLTTILTEQVKSKEESRKIMVAILSQIVEFRNGESGLHVTHVNALVKMLLERLRQVTDQYNISWVRQDLIVMASSLHDIGKIGIDDKILNKKGKLTKEEFEIMKTHTLIGASILENLEEYQQEPLVQTAYEICRWHHERYDGNGYPDGLKGEDIPISAQVVSLADVYDALVSKRVYKEGYTYDTAMHMILNGECGVFNPILIQCLRDIYEKIPAEIYRGGVKLC